MSKLKQFFGIAPKEDTADKLAQIVVNLLNNHAELWKFGGTKAEFEEYKIFVNFPSVESLTFSMRTQEHQAERNNVTPSKFMRKLLMDAVIEARNKKMLGLVTTELAGNRNLLLTDMSNG
jgi:hypothetical protein